MGHNRIQPNPFTTSGTQLSGRENCGNCHGESTVPLAPPQPGFSSQFYTPSPLENPECPAYWEWPPWTKYPKESLSKLDWWKRSNFEQARRSYRFWKNKTTLPFRLNLARAEFRATLPLRAQSISLKKFWFLDLAEAKFKPGAQINAQFKVADNALDLMLQSLVEMQGIWIDGPLDFNFWPKKLCTGDFGGLHLLMETNKDYYVGFMAQAGAYFSPRAPLCHDWFNKAVLDVYGRDYQPPPRLPPLDLDNHPPTPYLLDFTANPELEKFSNSLGWRSPIPKLVDHGARLPRHFELETLAGKILEWLQKEPDPNKKKSGFNLAKLGEFLAPGAELVLRLQDLQDLFIPGLLDLGPSSGQLKLRLEKNGNIRLDLNELHLQADPMDYPAVPGEQRPPVHLLEANLDSGPAGIDSLGQALPEGIQLTFDPQYRHLIARANLQLAFHVELPILGSLRVNAQILLHSELSMTDQGPKLLGGKNLLEIRNLEISQGPEGKKWLRNGKFLLSDRPELRDPLMDLLNFGGKNLGANTRYQLEFTGTLANEQKLQITSDWELPLSAFAFLDLSRLPDVFKVPIQVSLQDPRGLISRGEILFGSNRLWQGPLAAGGKRDYSIRVDWKTENPDPNRPGINIQDASLQWVPQLGDPRTWMGELFGDLPLLEIMGLKIENAKIHGKISPSKAGQLPEFDGKIEVNEIQTKLIHLQQPSFHFRLRPLEQDGTTSRFAVDRLALKANPHWVTRGKLLGPLQVEQKNRPGQALQVSWNSEKQTLSWTGLNLLLNAQGLNLLPPKIRRLLDPSIRMVGMDGTFYGNFDLHLQGPPNRWNGKGYLAFWGDPSGDIYWLDQHGQRVGPALLRNTHWQVFRLSGLNPQAQRIHGAFRLDMTVNPSAFLKKTQWEAAKRQSGKSYGARGQLLKPYEINEVRAYNRQPWSPLGILKNNLDYVWELCRRDPQCSQN